MGPEHTQERAARRGCSYPLFCGLDTGLGGIEDVLGAGAVLPAAGAVLPVAGAGLPPAGLPPAGAGLLAAGLLFVAILNHLFCKEKLRTYWLSILVGWLDYFKSDFKKNGVVDKIYDPFLHRRLKKA